MRQRLGRNISGGPDGTEYYQKRPIIHRNTPVLGRVYLGASPREAIVVDSEKYPALKKLYEEAKKRATDSSGKINKGMILGAVYNVVKEKMEPDEEKVDEIIEELGVGNDGKVALDVFIERGVGVCRHHALTCAALLELFKIDGYIRGTPSVDRNSTELGAHAWCRYTNSRGEVFILDPTLGFLGRLEDAEEKGIWQYKRPEDY
jgi:hypothetical protein